jgi:hypothetical protein
VSLLCPVDTKATGVLSDPIAMVHFRINVTDSFLDLSNFTPFHFPPRGKGYNTPSPLGEGWVGGNFSVKQFNQSLKNVALIVKNYIATGTIVSPHSNKQFIEPQRIP